MSLIPVARVIESTGSSGDDNYQQLTSSVTTIDEDRTSFSCNGKYSSPRSENNQVFTSEIYKGIIGCLTAVILFLIAGTAQANNIARGTQGPFGSGEGNWTIDETGGVVSIVVNASVPISNDPSDVTCYYEGAISVTWSGSNYHTIESLPGGHDWAGVDYTFDQGSENLDNQAIDLVFKVSWTGLYTGSGTVCTVHFVPRNSIAPTLTMKQNYSDGSKTSMAVSSGDASGWLTDPNIASIT